MVEHGYVQPKPCRKDHPGRPEAVRPLPLVHMNSSVSLTGKRVLG